MNPVVSADTTRELLAHHGAVVSQSVADWSGPFPLPDPVREYYESVGPDNVSIPAYGNAFYVPSLAKLWTHQAGYRYNAISGDTLEQWDDDWLVVADHGADPYIFSRSDGCVLLAQHGEGTWNPQRLFEDLNSMAACLAILGTVVSDAGLALTDEQSFILPRYRQLALQRLEELLGSSTAAVSVVESAGWG